MSARGFIRLPRGEFDDPLFDEQREYSRWEAWIDLLMNQARGIANGIERGQFQVSLNVLAAKWGWQRDRVYRFLGALQTSDRIRVIDKGDPLAHRAAVYEIVQFDRYNGENAQTSIKPGKRTAPATGSATVKPAPVLEFTMVSEQPPQQGPQHIKEERTKENVEGESLYRPSSQVRKPSFDNAGGRLSSQQLELIWGPIAQAGRGQSFGRDSWEPGNVKPELWDVLRLERVDSRRLVVTCPFVIGREDRHVLERAITRAAQSCGRLRGRAVELQSIEVEAITLEKEKR